MPASYLVPLYAIGGVILAFLVLLLVLCFLRRCLRSSRSRGQGSAIEVTEERGVTVITNGVTNTSVHDNSRHRRARSDPGENTERAQSEPLPRTRESHSLDNASFHCLEAGVTGNGHIPNGTVIANNYALAYREVFVSAPSIPDNINLNRSNHEHSGQTDNETVFTVSEEIGDQNKRNQETQTIEYPEPMIYTLRTPPAYDEIFPSRQ